MGIARKLENVHQGLTKLAKQGKVVGFLTNPENAQRIGDLVGEIDKAMADYQVCDKLLPLLYLIFVLDFFATRYLQQYPSAHCKSHNHAFCL